MSFVILFLFFCSHETVTTCNLNFIKHVRFRCYVLLLRLVLFWLCECLSVSSWINVLLETRTAAGTTAEIILSTLAGIHVSFCELCLHDTVHKTLKVCSSGQFLIFSFMSVFFQFQLSVTVLPWRGASFTFSNNFSVRKFRRIESNAYIRPRYRKWFWIYTHFKCNTFNKSTVLHHLKFRMSAYLQKTIKFINLNSKYLVFVPVTEYRFFIYVLHIVWNKDPKTTQTGMFAHKQRPCPSISTGM